jgi:hypothetical protein
VLILVPGCLKAYDIRLESISGKSEFGIFLLEGMKTEIMSSSPSLEIKIKLSYSENQGHPNFPDSLEFPFSPAIATIRFIKINKSETLVVMELVDMMFFSYNNDANSFSVSLYENSSLLQEKINPYKQAINQKKNE